MVDLLSSTTMMILRSGNKLAMTYSENGNISAKTDVGQYSYGYDWHRPFAVEQVTNTQGVIPLAALSTEFDASGKVSSITEYDTWRTLLFTYGPEGERWKTVNHKLARSQEAKELKPPLSFPRGADDLFKSLNYTLLYLRCEKLYYFIFYAKRICY